MEQILEVFRTLSGTAIAVVFVALVFLIAQKILASRINSESKYVPLKKVILVSLGFLGALVILMALPLSNETRGQIFSFIGIILSAGVALSSTTLLGNALAALMMRVINHFKVGDYIQTEDSFGRVTSRGLFHTEIQTADRDLRTLPNLHLATRPVTVIRNSGTIISAKVSLGYDVHRTAIEKSLIKAAKSIGLKDPFVLIMELGDYSVVYKVHGLLEDVSILLSMRSRLHKAMLDQLHESEIEIVSPTFMNQRQIEGQYFIPRASSSMKERPKEVEKLIFDKAEMARDIQDNKRELKELEEKIQVLEQELKESPKDQRLLEQLKLFQSMKQA